MRGPSKDWDRIVDDIDLLIFALIISGIIIGIAGLMVDVPWMFTFGIGLMSVTFLASIIWDRVRRHRGGPGR